MNVPASTLHRTRHKVHPIFQFSPTRSVHCFSKYDIICDYEVRQSSETAMHNASAKRSWEARNINTGFDSLWQPSVERSLSQWTPLLRHTARVSVLFSSLGTADTPELSSRRSLSFPAPVLSAKLCLKDASVSKRKRKVFSPNIFTYNVSRLGSEIAYRSIRYQAKGLLFINGSLMVGARRKA